MVETETEQGAFSGPPDSAWCAAVLRENVNSIVRVDQVNESQEHNIIQPWSFEELVRTQEADPDIGPIVSLLKLNADNTTWESISLSSRDTKTLWGMWPRLAIRNGLLKKKFETADGSSERWQIVWPNELRQEFLRIAHSGMTGGHMRKRRTAVAIQSRAYWPTRSSDLNLFMRM